MAANTTEIKQIILRMASTFYVLYTALCVCVCECYWEKINQLRLQLFDPLCAHHASQQYVQRH